jgi:hypothetical protein
MPFAQQTKHELVLARLSSVCNQTNVCWLSENRPAVPIPGFLAKLQWTSKPNTPLTACRLRQPHLTKVQGTQASMRCGRRAAELVSAFSEVVRRTGKEARDKKLNEEVTFFTVAVSLRCTPRSLNTCRR